MKLSQKNFNILIETFNHTTTKIQNDIKWMKRIGYYLAMVITTQLGVRFY